MAIDNSIQEPCNVYYDLKEEGVDGNEKSAISFNLTFYDSLDRNNFNKETDIIFKTQKQHKDNIEKFEKINKNGNIYNYD